MSWPNATPSAPPPPWAVPAVLTAENFRDWRVADSDVRPASVRQSLSGYHLSVSFPCEVRSQPGMASDRDGGFYNAGSSLDFNPNGTHKYGNLRLVYDPVVKAREPKWVVFSLTQKHGFNFNPSIRYSSEDEASEVATRLARIHSGYEFHVARILTSKRSPDPAPVETITYN